MGSIERPIGGYHQRVLPKRAYNHPRHGYGLREIGLWLQFRLAVTHHALRRPRSQKLRDLTADLRLTTVTGSSSRVQIPDVKLRKACAKAIASRDGRFFCRLQTTLSAGETGKKRRSDSLCKSLSEVDVWTTCASQQLQICHQKNK